MPKRYYKGMNEYRLEKITSTQGHYILAKNLKSAMRKAKFRANNSGTPWTVQAWKPKRGKRVYIMLPNSKGNLSKKDLVGHYKFKGYDISRILSDRYVKKVKI
jgi:hypothetical protein